MQNNYLIFAASKGRLWQSAKHHAAHLPVQARDRAVEGRGNGALISR